MKMNDLFIIKQTFYNVKWPDFHLIPEIPVRHEEVRLYIRRFRGLAINSIS